MRMKIVAAIAAIGVGIAGASVGIGGQTASAQDTPGPLKVRAQLMKMNGAAMGMASKMAKGEEPYDAAKAAEAMAVVARNMETFTELFPSDGAEMAPDAAAVDAAIQQYAAAYPDLLTQAESDDGVTRAKEEIWQDFAAFKAEADKTATDAKAAEAAAAEGQEAFQTALGAVGQNCGSCHEMFRGPAPN